jgi:peptide chain release factor 2
MRAQLVELEKRAADPELWADPDGARITMRRLCELREDLALWEGLATHLADLAELAAMVSQEPDDELAAEIARDARRVAAELDLAERRLLLSGEYDSNDALLAIHAGAGGTESQDWAAMLLRMYVRWAESRGFETSVVDETAGEEAGIKSVSLTIAGRMSYGLLRSERGVHRLVRISPFDASARRHTSFALVEVSPVIDDDVSVVIRDEDVRMDVFRSSGAGGQHVNKTSSAVRLTHLPTGIVVSCQNERSQAQNRQVAMKLMRARLLELELERREVEQARLKGQHVEAGWGNQIRSYVLQPYQMVKDHRSGFETTRTQEVLDGDLDALQDAYLRFQVAETVS